MSTSALLPVLNAVVAAATAGVAADTSVFTGWDASNVAVDKSLTIGSSDLASDSAVVASTSAQEMATAGTPRSRSQTGSLSAAAFVRRGDGDLLAAATDAYTIQAVIETALRADPRLGLVAYPLVVIQFGDESLSWGYDDGFAEALLVFNIQFEVRL